MHVTPLSTVSSSSSSTGATVSHGGGQSQQHFQQQQQKFQQHPPPLSSTTSQHSQNKQSTLSSIRCSEASSPRTQTVYSTVTGQSNSTGQITPTSTSNTTVIDGKVGDIKIKINQSQSHQRHTVLQECDTEDEVSTFLKIINN